LVIERVPEKHIESVPEKVFKRKSPLKGDDRDPTFVPLLVDTSSPESDEDVKTPTSEKRESRRGRYKCFKCIFHGTKEGIVRHVQGKN